MEDVFPAYLRRLGMVARPRPSAAALAELMARHMRTVPFENLDIVAGTPRPLSTDTALQKVVEHARGGFCYELNEAFRALLDHLKFTVRRIEARVWQATAQQFGAPSDHLVPVVSVPEGEFLVDVTLAEQPLEAFASMCRYHQSSPESIFSKGLICTRATETGRITLSRDRLIIMDDGWRTETITTNVSAVLNEHFGISDGRKR